MDIDGALTRLAKDFIRNRRGWEDIQRRRLPAELLELTDAIVAEWEVNLTADDWAKFRGFVPAITRSEEAPTPTTLASAKLRILLERRQRSVLEERYISGDFEDSQLLDAFPELQAEMDDEGLLPASLFKPLRDAFVYKDRALILPRLGGRFDYAA